MTKSYQQFETGELQVKLVKYFSRIGIALSVLTNVILGGPSNQTFSARNWGWKREGRKNFVWLIDGVCDYLLEPIINFVLTYLFRNDIKVSFKNHCMTSWIYWRIRKDVMHEIEKSESEKDNTRKFYNQEDSFYYDGE